MTILMSGSTAPASVIRHSVRLVNEVFGLAYAILTVENQSGRAGIDPVEAVPTDFEMGAVIVNR